MHVAVIGAGALGTLVGGRLAADGNEVALLHHRPEYARELESNGVRIEPPDRPPVSVEVPATADAATVGPVDLAVVAVKSHRTDAALSEHAAVVGPDTHLLSLQNMLDPLGRMAAVVGAGRALAGPTYLGADLDAPGRVVQTQAGETIIGPAGEFAGRAAEAFTAAGMEARAVEDPRPHVWDKQLASLAYKPVAALTRLPNGEIVDDEGIAAVVADLVRETVAVAEARGIDLPTDDPVGHVLAIGERNPGHRSSMLQDVEAGRPTEIDEANGALLELAAEAGVEVPTHRVLTPLVRGLERGYRAE